MNDLIYTIKLLFTCIDGLSKLTSIYVHIKHIEFKMFSILNQFVNVCEHQLNDIICVILLWVLKLRIGVARFSFTVFLFPNCIRFASMSNE